MLRLRSAALCRRASASEPFCPRYWRCVIRWLLVIPCALALAPTATAARAIPWYVTKQIQVAEIIGHESARDPWPNCPDPIFNGAPNWQATVNCENGGSWLDSPGYYRCGLQFDPGWERRYGRLCP
jgi:hypothetical protein